jgi:hypothetical protein
MSPRVLQALNSSILTRESKLLANQSQNLKQPCKSSPSTAILGNVWIKLFMATQVAMTPSTPVIV